MILVLTGTQEIPFQRLVSAVVELAMSDACENYFVIQSGSISDLSDGRNHEMFDYCSHDKLMELIESADMVITHGGTGSIVASLLKRKKVVVYPRMSKYLEHNDDHQSEIAQVFSEAGYVLVWPDDQDLLCVLKEAEKFTPEPYSSSFDKFKEHIEMDLQRFVGGGRKE